MSTGAQLPKAPTGGSPARHPGHGPAPAPTSSSAVAAAAEPESIRNLMVNYVPTTVDEMQLRALFETYGPVESVKIVLDRDSRSSRGYAFVKYRFALSAFHAIQNLTGYPVMNKRLKVSYANSAEAQKGLSVQNEQANQVLGGSGGAMGATGGFNGPQVSVGNTGGNSSSGHDAAAAGAGGIDPTTAWQMQMQYQSMMAYQAAMMQQQQYMMMQQHMLAAQQQQHHGGHHAGHHHGGGKGGNRQPRNNNGSNNGEGSQPQSGGPANTSS